jgi:probable HAF family extracellular repeat protein
MRRLLSLLVGLLALAGVVAASSGGANQAKPRWVITDLGTLSGRASLAVAINERGQVVGYADTKARDKDGEPIVHAFLWTKGKMRDLGTLGGLSSRATGINEAGQIVGAADTAVRDGDGYPVEHAFLWESGKMRDLGALGGSYSAADAINERGQVMGRVDTKAGHTHAFVWSGGKMTDLGTLAGQVEAVAINDRGQIVGHVHAKGTGTRQFAFLWQDGKMRNLGTLGGKINDAVAINNRGQVVGWSDPRAFIWERGVMRGLGAAKGFSEAVDINEAGWILGTADPGLRAVLWQEKTTIRLGLTDEASPTALNDQRQVIVLQASGWDSALGGFVNNHAFVWQSGITTPLPTLGGANNEAVAINNRGQIIGWSETKSGAEHAVLWTLKR